MYHPSIIANEKPAVNINKVIFILMFYTQTFIYLFRGQILNYLEY